METVLLTGGAGFIGTHLAQSLLRAGRRVIIVDNFNPFYDPLIKRRNIDELEAAQSPGALSVLDGDVCALSEESLRSLLHGQPLDAIIHLAAMAGVRPSIQSPILYQNVNVIGTQNMLEIARKLSTKRFILASSSSVYGVNPNAPWSEDGVLNPISPYAASKASAELLCSVYSHLYDMTCVALRLFTVYGPRQRPDLAISKFIANALNEKPITLYGNGHSKRDYTFVSDIVNAFSLTLKTDLKGFEIINAGCGSPISLLDLVHTIEEATGRTIKVAHVQEQPGDVPVTYANIQKACNLLGYVPEVSLSKGIRQQVEWYQRAF